MEGSEPKQRKVVNKKNDLLTKLRKKIKKKVKKKIKRNEKRDEGLNGIRQCRKNGMRELGKLRIKCAPGHEGMFLKGLRTQYISRETLNEANEARKNEDINKIIDIGRVFQKKGQKRGGRKRAFNLNSSPDNAKSQKIMEKDLTMASVDFNRCSLSTISVADSTTLPVANADPTIILHENDVIHEDHTTTATKKKLNFDKELVMFSLLYEEKVGSQLLPRVTENDILEEAFRALRNISETNKSKKDEAIENEFVKEFKFLREISESEMPLAEIFEDFHHGNHSRVTENKSPDIFMGFVDKPMEDLINLSGMGTCENDPMYIPLLDEEQRNTTELQTKEFEKSAVDINITTPQIQFYRRNMF